jgi:hypothetical protein
MMEQKELIEFIGRENFQYLPLMYATMQRSTNQNGTQVTLIESELHQTTLYEAAVFYKPVSRIFFPEYEK